MALRGLLLPGLLLCCSCITVSLGGRSEPPVIYEVNPPAPDRDGGSTGLVLRIRDFTAASSYDRTDMVVVDSTGRVTRAGNHRWASTPAALLADLLTRDALAESRFGAVYRRTALSGEDLVLEAHVREFGARWEASGAWTARMEVDLTLLDAATGSIVFQNTVRMSEQMASGGFDELASAMNRLVERWSAETRSELAGACSAR